MDKEGVVAKSAMSKLDFGSISSRMGKQASDSVASVSGRGGLVSWLMEPCGYCMFLSAETQCSLWALRFGAGEN